MDPLEFLAQSNGCMISDLRYWSPAQYDIAPLLEKDPEDFTLSGWNALLQYMFPSAPPFKTQAQARAYLEHNTKQKKTELTV